MSAVGWLRSKMRPQAGTDDYRPKFCRTRGCSLLFEHEGQHEGVAIPKAGPARKPKPTAKPHRTAGAARSDAWRSRAAHSLDAHARRAGR